MPDDLPDLEPTTPVARVALDLNICRVSTTVNPFSFWRKRMDELGVTPSTRLVEGKHGQQVRVAGIVIARARPPTRSGKTAIFITLEDEFGLVDVAVFEECYQRCGRALYASPVLCIEGTLTRQGARDVSVTARQVIALGNWDEFARAQGRGGDVPPPRLTPQQGNEMRRMDNRLMDRWEPQVNPKVGERRG